MRELHLERWDGAGVPITGDIDVTLRGFEQESDLATATGSVEVVCDPCIIEPSRIAPRAPNARAAKFIGDGISIPRVDLGMVRGEMHVAGGRATVEGRAVGGPAFEVTVSGTITFAPRMGDSMSEARYLIRPTADLATVDPAWATMFSLLGTPDESGAVTLTMRGPLDRMRPVR